MRLEGPSDTFELRLGGYEFPESSDWWDANWLVIAINATCEGRHWSAADAALLTIDVAELANWFERVATGRDVPEEIGFMEPCLTFTVERRGGEAQELCVNVSHELSPPWLEEDDRFGWGVRLRLSADPVALLDASASLRRQLQTFPPRGERDEGK
jgi:hypothetical protein